MAKIQYYEDNEKIPTKITIQTKDPDSYKYRIYQLGSVWGMSKIPKNWEKISKKKYIKNSKLYEHIADYPIDYDPVSNM